MEEMKGEERDDAQFLFNRSLVLDWARACVAGGEEP